MIEINDIGFINFFRNKIESKPIHTRSYFENIFLNNTTDCKHINIHIARGTGKSAFTKELWKAMIEYSMLNSSNTCERHEEKYKELKE